MPIYSDLVPSPLPGSVTINGTRYRAIWEFSGRDAKINALVTDDEAEKLLEFPLGTDPVRLELFRGEELIVSGEAYLDSTLHDGRLQMQVRFKSFATYRL